MRSTCSYNHISQLRRHSRWWLIQQWIWALTSCKLSLICCSAGRTPSIASSKSFHASQHLKRDFLLVEQSLWSCECWSSGPLWLFSGPESSYSGLPHLVPPLKLGPHAWAAQQAGCFFIQAWVKKVLGLTESTLPHQHIWQYPKVFCVENHII